MTKELKIPAYLRDLYPYYFSKRAIRFLSMRWYAVLTTFGFFDRLADTVAALISPSDSVMLSGVVAGGFEERLLAVLGEKGRFAVADVSEERLDACRERLFAYAKPQYVPHDVTEPFETKYDKIVCWFLLNEMPDELKKKTVDAVLASLKPDGTAIFVDYHAPKKNNVAAWIVKPVNRLFRPFAEGLWRHSLHSFAASPTLYSWNKKVFCLGLYQLVEVKAKVK